LDEFRQFSPISESETMSACAIDMVRDVVASARAAGVKAECAHERAAEILGVSPRWVRSVIRGEPHAVKLCRLSTIRDGYRNFLTKIVEQQERTLARMQARLSEMEAELASSRDPQLAQDTADAPAVRSALHPDQGE
jgi:predicted transcriptional regulator